MENKIQFKKTCRNLNGVLYLQEAEGELINIEGFPSVIEYDDSDPDEIDFSITELTTGMLIAPFFATREAAIEKATSRLKANPNFLQKGIDILKAEGIEYPVNNL